MFISTIRQGGVKEMSQCNLTSRLHTVTVSWQPAMDQQKTGECEITVSAYLATIWKSLVLQLYGPTNNWRM